MSKFTKEQLVEYVKGCIEHAERFPGVEIADKEKVIFEIALAVMVAKFGQIKRYELNMDGCDSCGQDCGADMVENLDGDYVLWEEVIPYLYRHEEYIAPIAHVEPEDRQSFESWYGATCGLSGSDLESEFNLDDAGEYIYSGAADAWKAWKASRVAMIQEPDGEPQLHVQDEEDQVSARRRRNRESNARARERETPTQRKARLAKNRARMAIRRKGGAK